MTILADVEVHGPWSSPSRRSDCWSSKEESSPSLVSRNFVSLPGLRCTALHCVALFLHNSGWSCPTFLPAYLPSFSPPVSETASCHSHDGVYKSDALVDFTATDSLARAGPTVYHCKASPALPEPTTPINAATVKVRGPDQHHDQDAVHIGRPRITLFLQLHLGLQSWHRLRFG